MSKRGTTFFPFVPTMPEAFAALKSVWPDGTGFVGHDGEQLWFQRRGDQTPVGVRITPELRVLLDWHDDGSV